MPEYDFYCPLMSLPLAFKTDLNSIPVAKTPYLRPDPADVEKWRERLAGDKKRRIGLVWAGDPRHKRDGTRSIVLCNLAPLAEIKNTTFYSLQKGDGAKHLPPPGLALTDFTSELIDFADTTAFIANLDLVIAVDTSVAHLAAAIGKPVWLLLPYSPDWRWLLDRADSPWYPTMRLFRQKTYGDWTDVIRNVTDALKAEE
jgi:Glycosyltransferase family 9 (heptosyltransferase)